MGPHSRSGLDVCTNDATYAHKESMEMSIIVRENSRTPNLILNALRELEKRLTWLFSGFHFLVLFFIVIRDWCRFLHMVFLYCQVCELLINFLKSGTEGGEERVRVKT